MSEFLRKYWWIAAGIAIGVLIFKKQKRYVRHRRHSRAVVRRARQSRRTVSAVRRRRAGGGGRRGFRRRIGNTIYTSPRSWSQAMQRRRKSA